MKRFTFFIEEYDQQSSITMHYKIHKHGRDANHAYHKAEMFMNTKFTKGLGYGYKLLTLNQFNSLKKKPNLVTVIWETLVALYPFKISIKH